MNATTEFRPTDIDTLAVSQVDIGIDETEGMSMIIVAFLSLTDAPWGAVFSFADITAWAMEGNPDVHELYKAKVKARGENFVTSGFFALEDTGYLSRTDHDGVITFKVTNKFVEVMRPLAQQ